ncbi:FAD-dependent oxidoreductase [Eggerthella sp. YY7918]|uniref:FAD-dependent oxidoreductase n=1 Tax=Eggerthella sp. (strain YY7918) TaxID=502558 RepID=UPI0002170EF6|nr:FAD-dependent oxidoreductase [Eggerthella sp. YY7918]BAK43672.1 hypothetical protein EGYY_04590 [Eggerthella sp. YY7918]
MSTTYQASTNSGMTRRTFLAGAGLVGAGTALGLAGCGPREQVAPKAEDANSEASTPNSQEVDPIWALDDVGEPTETIEAQVCIVGGGGTGLAAAIQCAELGLKPLVVEKMAGYGGSFIGTEFINAVGSKQQIATGVDDSINAIINDHLVYHHWIPRKALVESMYLNAADTIEWLEGFGVEFEFSAGYKNRALAYYAAGEPLRGSHFIKLLSEQADRMGVEALFETAAKKIVMDNGAVAGVLVEGKNGTVTKIETKAVLICTGGYSNNREFLQAVSHNENENIQALGMDCRHADGLKMAADAGAVMAEGLGTIQWCGPVVIGAITASWQTHAYAVGVQPTLWLNQDAKRFVREDLCRENFTFGGISVRNEKKTFVMFTEKDMEHWENVGVYIKVFGFANVDTPLTEARETLMACEACHVHDTIEEAAKAAGLDPVALQETIDRYNGFCEKAALLDPDDTTADEDFGKKAQHLRPVDEGPFWICEVANGFFATHGGVKVTEKTEALDADGKVITGLYAGGCDAGGIQGDTYDVLYAGGSTSGWAINTGRNAARAIAEFLQS